MGQLTELMQQRWYVLRDQALFIYNSRGQKVPTQIIPLVGLQICKLSPENNHHRLAICNGLSKSYPLKVLYHEDAAVIDDWVKKLKEQAQNLSFYDTYQKITEIGIGLSTVFKCRNKTTQEILAVKQIHKPNLTEQGKRRLREEIYVGCSLSHKHIVEIKEIFECESYIYIVMERVPGGDLQVYFNRYSLSERQVSLVMHQLLQSINYLSSHGIVHRDIKPQNILVDVVPNTKKIINIKLTDFGLSKIVKPGETMLESCGTPQYIAPEVLL